MTVPSLDMYVNYKQ